MFFSLRTSRVLDLGLSSLGDTMAPKTVLPYTSQWGETDVNYRITEHEKGWEGIPEAETGSPTLLPSCPIALAMASNDETCYHPRAYALAVPSVASPDSGLLWPHWVKLCPQPPQPFFPIPFLRIIFLQILLFSIFLKLFQLSFSFIFPPRRMIRSTDHLHSNSVSSCLAV